MNPTAAIRVVRELIVALDRRRPQVQRASEAAIAADSAALKRQALERLVELERERALQAPLLPEHVART
jgi:hypothetical protein